MILDVGCGYLGDHRRYANTDQSIGIDLHRGTADIICDVTNLPFREDTFSYVYCRNILEHLYNPLKALREIKRVMKKLAIVSITVPVHHNTPMDEFIKMILGFPLRFPISLARLFRWRRNMKKIGFKHVNRIKSDHISRYFDIVRTREEYSEHPIHYWLYGRKGKLVRRIIGNFVLKYPLPHILDVTARNIRGLCN